MMAAQKDLLSTQASDKDASFLHFCLSWPLTGPWTAEAPNGQRQHTFDHQQELAVDSARIAGTVGFLIGTSKTKFMNVNEGEGMLKLNGEDLENVEKFTYLGSKVLTDGNIIREVRTRRANTAVAFNSLNNIWTN